MLRFLWVENPFSNDVEPMILRFTRVVFGVSSSPYLLIATIKHHLQYYASNPVAELLSQSMYVDNVVAGGDTEEEAFRIYVEAKELLGHGSSAKELLGHGASTLESFCPILLPYKGRSMKEKVH